MSYQSLLRWYPKAWREENGAVFLGMLEDDATARGAAKPGVAEAWSIRVHGLAERASYKVALVFAVAALIGFGAPTILDLPQYFMEAPPTLLHGSAAVLVGYFGDLIGYGCLGLAVVTLLLRSGLVPTIHAAVAALSFVLAALAMTTERAGWAWGAIVGASRIIDPPAILSFGAEGALVFGFVGLCAVFAGVLQRIRSSVSRVALAALVAAPTAVMLFGTPLFMRGPETIAALLVVVIATAFLVAAIGRAEADPHQAAPQSSTPQLRVFATVCAMGGFIGVVSVCVMLAGSFLSIFPTSLLESNLLSAVPIAASIPTVLIAGWIARPHIGNLALWVAVLGATSFAVLGAGLVFTGMAPGAHHLLLLGAPPASVAVALLIGAALPTAPRLAMPLMVVAGLLVAPATATAFTSTLVVAPLACLGAGAWAVWRIRRNPRKAQTPPRTAARGLPA